MSNCEIRYQSQRTGNASNALNASPPKREAHDKDLLLHAQLPILHEVTGPILLRTHTTTSPLYNTLLSVYLWEQKTILMWSFVTLSVLRGWKSPDISVLGLTVEWEVEASSFSVEPAPSLYLGDKLGAYIFLKVIGRNRSGDPERLPNTSQKYSQHFTCFINQMFLCLSRSYTA